MLKTLEVVNLREVVIDKQPSVAVSV